MFLFVDETRMHSFEWVAQKRILRNTNASAIRWLHLQNGGAINSTQCSYYKADEAMTAAFKCFH